MKPTAIPSAGALIILLAACNSLHAQPRVHPFEPPPALQDTTPGAAAKPPAGCNPGSVVRNGNIVTVGLSFVRANFTINNPDSDDGEDPVTLRSFGGCKSGPVIEVRPGNTLRIDLKNELEADDPSCLPNPPAGLGLGKIPGVGCFNTVNLHTHGLHVSPAGNSDNVLLSIKPQTSFPYEINLPADHPAGTFWYHAHQHGSTAVQVSSGAAGILVVRGDRPSDIDTILHDQRGVPMPEKLFLFQQIAYACFKNDPGQPGGPWQKIYTKQGIFDADTIGGAPGKAPWTCPLPTPEHPVSRGVIENFFLQLDSGTIWDTNGRFTSVNGVVQPFITVPAGEIQRWRFVHGGVHDTVNIQVVRAAAGSERLIANSALSGNRQQQQADLAKACGLAAGNSLVPQFEIANDGLTRAKLRTLSGAGGSGAVGSNYLQPGYRSDVLIVFPSDGEYCLLDQAAPPQERVSSGGGGQGPSVPQLLAYIHVRGGHPISTDPGEIQRYVEQSLYDTNPQLPADRRKRLLEGDLSPWAPFTELAPAPPGNAQLANFSINPQPVGPVLFQINGKSYDPDVVNVTRQVNTSDDWTLTSQVKPHVYHIHVNPFEIIDVTQPDKSGKHQVSIFDEKGTCKPSMQPDSQGLVNQYCSLYHVFKDTLFVENGFQVHIRTRYDRYIGEFVMHCHILDHEDGGMMMNVKIVPDLSAPGGGVGMAGMKHQP